MDSLLELVVLGAFLSVLAKMLPISYYLLAAGSPATCALIGWIIGEPSPAGTPPAQWYHRVIGIVCTVIAMALVTLPWLVVGYLPLWQWLIVPGASVVWCCTGMVASHWHHRRVASKRLVLT